MKMTPEQSGERIRREIAQWARVIEDAKIKAELIRGVRHRV